MLRCLSVSESFFSFFYFQFLINTYATSYACALAVLCVRVRVRARVLPLERVHTRAAAFAYMHKELQIESSGAFGRLSAELLMEFTAPPVTLEKCWRRREASGTDERGRTCICGQTQGGRGHLRGLFISISCAMCEGASKMLFSLKVFFFFFLRAALPPRGPVRCALAISLWSRKLIFGERPAERRRLCAQAGILLVAMPVIGFLCL